MFLRSGAASWIRRYWDEQARENFRWHIAHEHDEAGFSTSGRVSAELLFGPELAELPRSGTVLDIGCGAGRILEHLAPARPKLRLFGVDVSAEMIRLAQERLRQFSNVVLLRGDGRSLDLFPDACFDVVYSALVFQHLPTRVLRRYLVESARVLRPGGQLRFQIQFDRRRRGLDLRSPRNFRSIRYYGIEEIREFTRNDFEVIEHTDPGDRQHVHDFLWTLRKR